MQPWIPSDIITHRERHGNTIFIPIAGFVFGITAEQAAVLRLTAKTHPDGQMKASLPNARNAIQRIPDERMTEKGLLQKELLFLKQPP